MANATLHTMVHHLRQLVRPDVVEVTDRELLGRFSLAGDQAAFAQLVERHAALVMGVCRRILGGQHDAEDAFQAVFLVLARKANSSSWTDSIGHWLYEVAHRTAQKARVSSARRIAREKRAAEMSRPESSDANACEQLQALIDDEIRQLPRAYVMPLVLCCLQNCTHEQAASQLGVTEGTIRARLWRGRELLRKRLNRRGITLSAGLLTMIATPGFSHAVVPTHELLERTVQAASEFAVSSAASAAAGESAMLLAEGVLSTMMMSKIQWAVLLVVSSALTFGGVGYWLQPMPAAEPVPTVTLPIVAAVADDEKNEDDKAEKKARETTGIIRAIDASKNVFLAKLEEDDGGDVSCDLAPMGKVFFNGVAVKLGDLKPGMHYRAVFNQEETLVVELHTQWPRMRAKMKEIDPATSKIIIAGEINGQEFDLPFTVQPSAIIRCDGLKVGLQDLAMGEAEFQLSLDKKQITTLDAHGTPGDLPASLVRLDAVANRLIVQIGVSGLQDERHVEIAFDLRKDSKIRYQGKDIAVADLKAGMAVILHFDTDRKTVVKVLADDATPKSNAVDED